MKNLTKFLEFNGEQISVLMHDGIWWIAIKPICEALNIPYKHQWERAQEHPILRDLIANKTCLSADKKMREMVCLPERYIYGWLFSIVSDNPVLIEYQLKCYDILFQHFHGAMSGRVTALAEKDEVEERIKVLEKELKQMPQSLEIERLKKQDKNIDKTLDNLDVELRQKQLRLDF